MRFPLLAGLGLVIATSSAHAQIHGTTSPGTLAPLTSAPDPDASIDAYVRSTLGSTGDDFERRGSYRVASGTVVRYVQRHDGVLVRDGGCAVLVSPAGTVLALNDFSARSFPAAPAHRIPASDAAARARAIVGGIDPGDDLSRTFLVWTREFGSAQLVYECDLQPALPNVPDAPRVLIRAEDGVAMRRTNRARTFNGNVYAANPVATPTRTIVPLTGLPDGSTALAGEDVVGFNCVDNGTIASFGGMRAHLCVGEHTAHPDMDGLFDAPVIDPMDPTSGYGELSMYYHVTDYLRFVRALGLPNFRTRPLNVYANTQFPWTDSSFGASGTDLTGPLLPWNNAAFMPGTPPNALAELYGHGHDVIMFGLGSSVNFAYDGDVVAHESGHSLVASTADFGDSYLDRWGLQNAPGALNEGLADYFSAARAGDPDVGEYAGQFEGGAIRSLNGTTHYPDDLQGEVHADSLPSSSPLWALRTQFGAEFDRAVYEALTMETSQPSEFSFATLVVDATRRILGPMAADAATQEYTRRGIMPEVPRAKAYNRNGSFFMLPGTTYSRLPYVPGYFQYIVNIPVRTIRVNVETRIVAFGDYNNALHVNAHFGGPVEFQFAGRDITSNSDAELSLVDPGSRRMTGSFDVSATTAPTQLYLSIGMEDGIDSYVTLRVTTVQEPAPIPDAGVRSDASDGGTAPAITVGGGCGCVVPARSGPSRGRNIMIAALALATVCASRKRRRA